MMVSSHTTPRSEIHRKQFVTNNGPLREHDHILIQNLLVFSVRFTQEFTKHSETLKLRRKGTCSAQFVGRFHSQKCYQREKRKNSNHGTSISKSAV